MILRRKSMSPESILRLAFVSLILASLGRWFLRPSTGVPEDLADGLLGLLYGVTIGLFLVGLWARARRAGRGG